MVYFLFMLYIHLGLAWVLVNFILTQRPRGMGYPSSKLLLLGRNNGDRLHRAFYGIFFMLGCGTYYFYSYSMAQAVHKAKALLQNKDMQKEREKIIITK